LSREYKTIKGTSQLIFLKNSMNTKRTQLRFLKGFLLFKVIRINNNEIKTFL
jgi:hypothetical protein